MAKFHNLSKNLSLHFEHKFDFSQSALEGWQDLYFQVTVNKYSLKGADGWTQTQDLGYRKQLFWSRIELSSFAR